MYEQDDETRKERFDVHNEAEILIKKTEQGLLEKGRNLDKADKKRIKASLAQLKKTVYRSKPATMSADDLLKLKYEKKELENDASILDIL